MSEQVPIESNMIEVTPEDLKKLKQLYKVAHTNKIETFLFKGHELVTDYAKYLIEYLDQNLKE